jgi:hypothetical protein
MQKSPGGSIFPYYYKGGELHCLKYGSFHEDYEGLFKLMDEEKDFVQKHDILNIWVDFYGTKITGKVMRRFYDNVSSISGNINRFAVVGVSPISRFLLKRILRKTEFPMKYFDDPEEAKTWIVSGRTGRKY